MRSSRRGREGMEDGNTGGARERDGRRRGSKQQCGSSATLRERNRRRRHARENTITHGEWSVLPLQTGCSSDSFAYDLLQLPRRAHFGKGDALLLPSRWRCRAEPSPRRHQRHGRIHVGGTGAAAPRPPRPKYEIPYSIYVSTTFVLLNLNVCTHNSAESTKRGHNNPQLSNT